MTTWYYRSGGKEIGPIGPGELLELVRKGVVSPETELRKEDNRWLLASDVNGLWEAAGRPSVGFKCPYCSKPITKPPCLCKSCNRQIEKATGHLVLNKLSRTPEKPLRPDLD
jgi:GYF domain 2